MIESLEREAASLMRAQTWADFDDAHRILARLRAEDPVHYNGDEKYPSLWHITKHADLFELEGRSDIFINKPRTMVMSKRLVSEMMSAFGNTNPIRSLVVFDGDLHKKMRFLTQAWFMPKNLRKMQTSISKEAERSIAKLNSFEGACDFATDIALEFPLRVIMAVLGIPEDDYGKMLRLTQELFGAQDPELARQTDSDSPTGGLMEAVQEYMEYFQDLTAKRRANPTDDVASVIANAEIDGEPLNFMDQLGYYVVIATAGHDTTSYSLSVAVKHIAKDPELLRRLKAAPTDTAPKLAEEAIRLASPAHHFMRTATADYELRGKTIRKGDEVIMWYASGSRDEELYHNPNQLDLDREMKVRHASFGHGPHLCLGMHLARQELTEFLVQFAEKIGEIRLNGEVTYSHSAFVGGVKHLPVSFKR